MPVSGRIPEDLYQWLSSTPLDGATTMSDKLRVAVATLKRMQDGDADYNGALAMHRDLGSNARQQLAQLEPANGHSEVLSSIMEHAPAIAAALTSAQIKGLPDAIQLEALLTQRSLQLAESLLRQAITPTLCSDFLAAVDSVRYCHVLHHRSALIVVQIGVGDVAHD